MAPAASGRRMIMRLIDADKLLTKAVLINNLKGQVAWSAVPAIAILAAPTIDAVPVRHGRWETNSDRPDTLICSVCKCGFDMWKHDPHNFCSNCGAKMDEVSE